MNKKLPPYQRKKSSPAEYFSYGNTTTSQNPKTIPMATQVIPELYAVDLPKGMVALETQVAGHTFQSGTDAIGLLKDQHDGSIMKPATKPLCGVREIKFYERLETTKDPILLELKELVPEYRGTITLHLGGRDVNKIHIDFC